jgi:UTP--glucose-1-phosphate uridylyltransferase
MLENQLKELQIRVIFYENSSNPLFFLEWVLMERLPWCLYLPGVCIHHASGTMHEEPLHLESELSISLQCHHFETAPGQQKSPDPADHPALRATTSVRSSAIARNGSSGAARADFILSYNLSLGLAILGHDTNGKQAFENTSTSVAASQMRNALNNLADTVTDPEDKKVCHTPRFARLHPNQCSF